MLHPAEFFREPRVHSRRKHRLLRKYLPAWAAKLGRYQRVIYCVDGFAGAGQYEDTGDDGSPLMMVKLIDQASSWPGDRELRVIAVEDDPTLCAKLVPLVRPWIERGAVSVRQGEFVSVLPSILDEIGQAPAYFFLDPFSQTPLPFPSGVDPILSRSAPTDVSLMFFGPGMHRMASRLCERPSRKPAVTKGAAATVATVNRIVGSPDWQTGFCAIGDAAKQIERLEEQYLRGVRTKGFSYGIYPIRPSLGRSAVYDFVHIARHPDAFLLMSDCIHDEEERLHQEFREESGQEPLPGFGADGRRTERRRELRGLVLQELRAHSASQDILRRKILIDGRRFGDFHSRDFTAVRNDLVSAGQITQARPGDHTKNANTVWRLTASQ